MGEVEKLPAARQDNSAGCWTFGCSLCCSVLGRVALPFAEASAPQALAPAWGELGWSCRGLPGEVSKSQRAAGDLSSACGSTLLISAGEQRAGSRLMWKEVTDLKLLCY